MVSQSSNAFTSEDTDTKRTTSDTSSQPQTASKRKQGSSRRVNGSRLCFICLKEEVSVVLLPCAHQTFCAKCNEDHEKKAKTRCPACQTVIEQRVRVYGASSQTSQQSEVQGEVRIKTFAFSSGFFDIILIPICVFFFPFTALQYQQTKLKKMKEPYMNHEPSQVCTAEPFVSLCLCKMPISCHMG